MYKSNAKERLMADPKGAPLTRIEELLELIAKARHSAVVELRHLISEYNNTQMASPEHNEVNRALLAGADLLVALEHTQDLTEYLVEYYRKKEVH